MRLNLPPKTAWSRSSPPFPAGSTTTMPDGRCDRDRVVLRLVPLHRDEVVGAVAVVVARAVGLRLDQHDVARSHEVGRAVDRGGHVVGAAARQVGHEPRRRLVDDAGHSVAVAPREQLPHHRGPVLDVLGRRRPAALRGDRAVEVLVGRAPAVLDVGDHDVQPAATRAGPGVLGIDAGRSRVEVEEVGFAVGCRRRDVGRRRRRQCGAVDRLDQRQAAQRVRQAFAEVRVDGELDVTVEVGQAPAGRAPRPRRAWRPPPARPGRAGDAGSGLPEPAQHRVDRREVRAPERDQHGAADPDARLVDELDDQPVGGASASVRRRERGAGTRDETRRRHDERDAYALLHADFPRRNVRRVDPRRSCSADGWDSPARPGRDQGPGPGGSGAPRGRSAFATAASWRTDRSFDPITVMPRSFRIPSSSP